MEPQQIQVPPGFRFKPYNKELISYYLVPKINGDVFPLSFMHEVNIYNHTPDYLVANYSPQGEGEWYFLTPRDKKYINGSRPNRKAGHGFWKANGVEQEIKDENNRMIGSHMTLDYYNGNPKENEKTYWKMHEFRASKLLKRKRGDVDVPSEVDTTMRLDEYVLCRIYHSKRSRENPAAKGVAVDENANSNHLDTLSNLNANANNNAHIPSNHSPDRGGELDNLSLGDLLSDPDLLNIITSFLSSSNTM
ncbi:NAC transcription factor 25-like [Spinacia oleracea]|uniref:NAC transcription factor 25-like n=1 Tax=Spinacia oleracea TaxID=3562 RepID=A0A9R0K3A2_SPIOL|nr:NAC transcription factor 25-like [Spinacia oleracea]